MRKVTFFVLAGLVVGILLGFMGVAVACDNTANTGGAPIAVNQGGSCFPTPADCATGNYNGTYTIGPPGRGSICLGGGGHVILYTGGNANVPCGTIVIADQDLFPGPDPNTCP
jgi:hypothetical protein